MHADTRHINPEHDGGASRSYWTDVRNDIKNILTTAFLSTGKPFTNADLGNALESVPVLQQLLADSKDARANHAISRWIRMATGSDHDKAQYQHFTAGTRMHLSGLGVEA
jgi:hypothetical protein